MILRGLEKGHLLPILSSFLQSHRIKELLIIHKHEFLIRDTEWNWLLTFCKRYFHQFRSFSAAFFFHVHQFHFTCSWLSCQRKISLVSYPSIQCRTHCKRNVTCCSCSDIRKRQYNKPLFPLLWRNGKTGKRKTKLPAHIITWQQRIKGERPRRRWKQKKYASNVSFFFTLNRRMRKCVRAHNRSGSPIFCRFLSLLSNSIFMVSLRGDPEKFFKANERPIFFLLLLQPKKLKAICVEWLFSHYVPCTFVGL